LDDIGITANKNAVPFDTESPFVTSGLRFGTPAATSRGFKEDEFKKIVDIVDLVLSNPDDVVTAEKAQNMVLSLCEGVSIIPNTLMRIGYLGPKGTFTHFACQKAIQVYDLADSEMIDYQSLDRMFDALTNESVDYIFSPIENSIEGPVNRVLDTLTHIENAYIHSSYTMPINQSMLSFNGTISPTKIQTYCFQCHMPSLSAMLLLRITVPMLLFTMHRLLQDLFKSLTH
jgi:hypothetical protein